MPKISDIEGIGPSFAQKLKRVGISSPQSLLKEGSTSKGRKLIAEKGGISDSLILEWVNRADLFRIKGVGGQYSDLLEAAGVDTVPELATRNANNLHQKILETNQEKTLVRKPPTLSQVDEWIRQAKQLPRAVNY